MSHRNTFETVFVANLASAVQTGPYWLIVALRACATTGALFSGAISASPTRHGVTRSPGFQGLRLHWLKT